MAAMPTVIRLEMRTPAMITGQASGSRTRISCWVVFIPMPLADSTTAGLTESRPVTVLRRTGMSAYRNRASIAGGLPMPTSGMKRANRASEGIVSTMPESASTTARATGRRWITTPSNTEVTVASATTISTILAWARVSSRMNSRLSFT